MESLLRFEVTKPLQILNGYIQWIHVPAHEALTLMRRRVSVHGFDKNFILRFVNEQTPTNQKKDLLGFWMFQSQLSGSLHGKSM